MENLQRLWLEKEKAMDYSGFQFKLCRASIYGTPGVWVPWPEWDWDEYPKADFKTLGQNEMCFDLDITEPLELYFTAKALKERLVARRIPHYIYDSGGKGYHFQIWMKSNNPEIDWGATRNKVARELLHGLIYRTKVERNWQWNIDPRKWNWDCRGKGSVVRAVGSKKRYYKYMIEELQEPDRRRRITRPVYPDSNFKFDMWLLPEQIAQQKTSVPTEFDYGKLLADTEVPICIEYLVEQEETGVHLNHLQRVAIVAHLWKSWKAKHLFEKMGLVEFAQIGKIFANDPDYSEQTTMYQINNIVQSLEVDPWKVPGCRFMKREGLVDTDLCQFCSKEVKKK